MRTNTQGPADDRVPDDERGAPPPHSQRRNGLSLNPVGFVSFVAIMWALSVAMIVVGAGNLNECKVQPFIPYWLLITGISCIFWPFMLRVVAIKGILNFEKFEISFFYTTATWFIGGNVWVFRNFAPNTSDSNLGNYCNHTVYYFSFWFIITVYIAVVLACCCRVSLAVYRHKAARNSNPSGTEGEAALITSN